MQGAASEESNSASAAFADHLRHPSPPPSYISLPASSPPTSDRTPQLTTSSARSVNGKAMVARLDSQNGLSSVIVTVCHDFEKTDAETSPAGDPTINGCEPSRKDAGFHVDDDLAKLSRGASRCEAFQRTSSSAGTFLKDQIVSFFQVSDNKLALKLFGNKNALQKEKLRQKAAGNWVIHPCSNFR